MKNMEISYRLLILFHYFRYLDVVLLLFVLFVHLPAIYPHTWPPSDHSSDHSSHTKKLKQKVKAKNENRKLLFCLLINILHAYINLL